MCPRLRQHTPTNVRPPRPSLYTFTPLKRDLCNVSDWWRVGRSLKGGTEPGPVGRLSGEAIFNCMGQHSNDATAVAVEICVDESRCGRISEGRIGKLAAKYASASVERPDGADTRCLSSWRAKARSHCCFP